MAGGNFTRGFAAREIPSGLRPQGNMAAPPPLARSRIPPATQAKEAEIKLIGSVLEEEANMAEIEEDKGDARIWLPNIDGFFIPLVDY